MEKVDYRDNLEAILAFTGGKALLSTSQIAAYTGLCTKTVRKRFHPVNGYISAPTLARALCSEVRE